MAVGAGEEEEQGASPAELLLEAARRNNTSLLTHLFSSSSSSHDIAALLNGTTDSTGASALHIAAGSGSYDVLDAILDQEGVEVDPVERTGGETPLHRAVQSVLRENSKGSEAQSVGEAVLEMLLDAGSDPRIRNKAGEKPVDQLPKTATTTKSTETARRMLERAEWAMNGEGTNNGMGLFAGDVVPHDGGNESDGPSDDE